MFHCLALKQSLSPHGLIGALDDRELVDRCRRGDQEAFRELVDAYKRMVFAIISRSAADRSQIEDLAQDVFVRVHRGLVGFRGDSRLSTWICRIALNVCANARKSRPNEVLPAEVAIADRAFNDFELRDRVARAMARLSERSRVVLTMYYFAGRSYEEIAGELDVPVGTVKTHLHRAKNELREILETDHDA